MNRTFFALLLAIALGAPVAQTQTSDIFDAARADDVKPVQALLDNKADTNQVNESGYTALTLASYNDHCRNSTSVAPWPP
jgi:ankyrin repeat protein